jgi:hypothetical protein
MMETDNQEAVTREIINGNSTELQVGLTDSELAIIVQIGDADAAYTAEEARQLANTIQNQAEQRWKEDHNSLTEYIRDLAQIVDNEATVEEVFDKWEGEEILTTLSK